MHSPPLGDAFVQLVRPPINGSEVDAENGAVNGWVYAGCKCNIYIKYVILTIVD